mgnify:CR=1 FL=1
MSPPQPSGAGAPRPSLVAGCWCTRSWERGGEVTGFPGWHAGPPTDGPAPARSGACMCSRLSCACREAAALPALAAASEGPADASAHSPPHPPPHASAPSISRRLSATAALARWQQRSASSRAAGSLRLPACAPRTTASQEARKDEFGRVQCVGCPVCHSVYNPGKHVLDGQTHPWGAAVKG